MVRLTLAVSDSIDGQQVGPGIDQAAAVWDRTRGWS